MNNAATLNYIYSNYNKLLKSFSSKGEYHHIEDCLSRLTVRLLSEPYDIRDPVGFVSSSVFQEMHNRRTTDKKYVLSGLSHLDLFPCEFRDTIDLETKIQLVKDSLSALTPGQEMAVNNYLKYGNNFVCPGENSNTQKGQYRRAILKLREILK